MPKGTTPHHQKKNSTMAEAWRKRKAAINAADERHQWFQGDYRRRCITERMGTSRFTEKNKKEADAMGIKGVIRMV